MKKEEDFLAEARVSDPGHALEDELVDVEGISESLETAQEFPEVPLANTESEQDSEVNFDDQPDPAFQKSSRAEKT